MMPHLRSDLHSYRCRELNGLVKTVLEVLHMYITFALVCIVFRTVQHIRILSQRLSGITRTRLHVCSTPFLPKGPSQKRIRRRKLFHLETLSGYKKLLALLPCAWVRVQVNFFPQYSFYNRNTSI
jgi:hypothetical protein